MKTQLFKNKGWFWFLVGCFIWGWLVLARPSVSQAAGPVAVTFTKTSDWGTGYNATITITNNGTTAVNGWNLQFDMVPTITSLWDGVHTGSGNHHTVTGAGWNNVIPPGGSAQFGFGGAYSGTFQNPANCVLNGQACTFNGANPTSTATGTTAATSTISATATPTSGGVCMVSYTIASDWGTGFGGDVKITNNGVTAVNNWTLTWTFPGNQLITSMWDATYSQSGPNATVHNGSWNGTIAVGATVGFGFNGSYSGTNAKPTNFVLNGVACNGGVNPTATIGATATATNPPTNTPLPTATGTAGPTSTPQPTPTPGNPSAKRIIAYYTAWSVYGRNFHVPDIPADKLTHINYAFANISGGKCVLGDPYADIDKFYPGDSWDAGALRGSFHRLQILKQQHPNVKTLISVGGWTWSTYFSDVALTATSRQVFAQSCVQFMKQYGFDGIDIDWEYPVSGGLPTNVYRPADKHNYTLLLAELRNQLNAQGTADGRSYLLTIAAPAGPGIYANLELNQIHPYLDWVNLMTYDFHGGWESTTNFNAPLYATTNDPSPDPSVRLYFNTSSAVQGYLGGGIPANKIVVGVPFYGRGWAGVPNVNNGLYQSSTGLPQGTWEAGVFDYKDLLNNYLGHGYTRYWNSQAQVPWLYNPSNGVMISYDDPQSIGLKADYINQWNLGGAMFWEISGDNNGAADSLLNTLYNHFNP